MTIRALGPAVAGICLLAAAGCATLPDTDALIERHAGQTARFESARGPLSARQSAVVLAKLKGNSGDIDILEKQIVLDQAINDSPLILGNNVTLLQDGAATYPAMFAADLTASDAIDLEAWQRRPIEFHIKEWMARVWGRLL